MADETKIINGFFKGVPINIQSGSVDGGRKVSIKQFPNRDTQNIEDLGLQPRRYSLEISVNDKVGQDYFNYRNRLLAALESKGPGVLIHPLYGRINDVVAINFSLSENFNEFGSTTVSVNFEVQNNTGIPQSVGNTVTSIQTKNTTIQQAVKNDITENYGVTPAFAGNFQAAVDKLDGLISTATEVVSFIGQPADTLNEFSAEIGRLSGDTNGIVSEPLRMASEVIGLFESVNGLYTSADATFDTFVGFFGFGDDDISCKCSTAGLVERNQNNKVINSGVAASALGYTYLAASQLEFQTVDEIDTVAAELDIQFAAVQESEADQNVKDAVTETRIAIIDIFNEKRITTAQVLTVDTLLTSTRLLAFSYYGNDEQGQILTDLNDQADINFISGDVKVLTA
jgi:prophage DNA circulation protein